MKMITGICPDCKAEIAPAKDEQRFKINLALHRRAKHGYKSPKHKYHTRRWKNRNRTAKLPKKRWTALNEELAAPTPAPVSSGIPLKLSSCPCCGAEFYYRKTV